MPAPAAALRAVQPVVELAPEPRCAGADTPAAFGLPACLPAGPPARRPAGPPALRCLPAYLPALPACPPARPPVATLVQTWYPPLPSPGSLLSRFLNPAASPDLSPLGLLKHLCAALLLLHSQQTGPALAMLRHALDAAWSAPPGLEALLWERHWAPAAGGGPASTQALTLAQVPLQEQPHTATTAALVLALRAYTAAEAHTLVLDVADAAEGACSRAATQQPPAQHAQQTGTQQGAAAAAAQQAAPLRAQHALQAELAHAYQVALLDCQRLLADPAVTGTAGSTTPTAAGSAAADAADAAPPQLAPQSPTGGTSSSTPDLGSPAAAAAAGATAEGAADAVNVATPTAVAARSGSAPAAAPTAAGDAMLDIQPPAAVAVMGDDTRLLRALGMLAGDAPAAAGGQFAPVLEAWAHVQAALLWPAQSDAAMHAWADVAAGRALAIEAAREGLMRARQGECELRRGHSRPRVRLALPFVWKPAVHPGACLLPGCLSSVSDL